MTRTHGIKLIDRNTRLMLWVEEDQSEFFQSIVNARAELGVAAVDQLIAKLKKARKRMKETV